MTRQAREYEWGLAALRSASGALDTAELEHWFFGGWAVDLWVGRLTRLHDDIDVLAWREDEAATITVPDTAGSTTKGSMPQATSQTLPRQ